MLKHKTLKSQKHSVSWKESKKNRRIIKVLQYQDFFLFFFLTCLCKISPVPQKKSPGVCSNITSAKLVWFFSWIIINNYCIDNESFTSTTMHRHYQTTSSSCAVLFPSFMHWQYLFNTCTRGSVWRIHDTKASFILLNSHMPIFTFYLHFWSLGLVFSVEEFRKSATLNHVNTVTKIHNSNAKS